MGPVGGKTDETDQSIQHAVAPVGSLVETGTWNLPGNERRGLFAAACRRADRTPEAQSRAASKAREKVLRDGPYRMHRPTRLEPKIYTTEETSSAASSRAGHIGRNKVQGEGACRVRRHSECKTARECGSASFSTPKGVSGDRSVLLVHLSPFSPTCLCRLHLSPHAPAFPFQHSASPLLSCIPPSLAPLCLSSPLTHPSLPWSSPPRFWGPRRRRHGAPAPLPRLLCRLPREGRPRRVPLARGHAR